MRVIVAAAGTGGHINPALAIANKIAEENPNSEIIFYGTKRGLENDLVPRAGYELKHIDAYGMQAKMNFTNIKQMIITYMSTFKVKKFLKEFKPDIVIGTGGYICGPVFRAANMLKIPTVLHESNAYPGKAVKLFSKKADRVLLGFEKARDFLDRKDNVVVTGNPTKIKKKEFSEKVKKGMIEDLGLHQDKPIVLIFGGSQGAQRINEAVTDIIIKHPLKDYQILWATGPKQFEIVKQKLEEEKLDIENIKNAKIVPYIYNMEELINICDLVVCRSGAMTITEIGIVQKPAIFIPLPSIRANRQEDNARVLERLGAARVILNNELTGDILEKDIAEMTEDLDKLKEMGKKANSIEIKDVENKIYKEINNVLERR